MNENLADQLQALQSNLDRLADELTHARRELVQLKREATQNVRESSPPPEVTTTPPPAIELRPDRPSAAANAPPVSRPRAPRPPAPDTENLIGRYGALVLGALTVLMGIGALVSWAVANDLLGPKVRVGLGALLTATLALVGWGVRDKNPRFGNTLLALSVGLLQVVAWGAGPALKIVSPTIALEVADLGSLLLVALALKEKSESLFVVGFGASLLAPFVMRTGTDRFLLLAIYGLIVIAGSLRAIRGQLWPRARIVAIAATVIYSSVVSLHTDVNPWLSNTYGVAFALVITLLSFLFRTEGESPALTLSGIAMASILCAIGVTLPLSPAAPTNAILAGATFHVVTLLAVFGVAHCMERMRPDVIWWIMVTTLPLILLDSPFDFQPTNGASAGIRFGLAAVYAIAAFTEKEHRRAGLLILFGLASGWAVYLAAPADLLPLMFAAHAIALAGVVRFTKVPTAIIPAAVTLSAGWFLSIVRLVERGYSNTPFLSSPSLTCGALTLAVFAVTQLGANESLNVDDKTFSRGALAAGLACIAAFFWAATELALAFNHDTATFLLVFYIAACGVVLIALGRKRRVQGLRQLGLTLAVISALYALLSASSVQQIGFRVGSYLAVGAFLLGVAWWYRADVADTTSTAR